MIKILRKRLTYILPILLVIMVLGIILSRIYQPEPGIPEPEINITASEAIQHIGKAAEVCGFAVNARFLPRVGGQPTFINFGEPSPNQDFTAIIWGENRGKWSEKPEVHFAHKDICVTGTIESHKGTPQIEVRDPKQIILQ